MKKVLEYNILMLFLLEKMRILAKILYFCFHVLVQIYIKVIIKGLLETGITLCLLLVNLGYLKHWLVSVLWNSGFSVQAEFTFQSFVLPWEHSRQCLSRVWPYDKHLGCSSWSQKESITGWTGIFQGRKQCNVTWGFLASWHRIDYLYRLISYLQPMTYWAGDGYPAIFSQGA